MIASLAGVAVLADRDRLKPPPEVPAGIAFVRWRCPRTRAPAAIFAWVALLAPPAKVGTVSGIVGAAGGLGGYFPPLVMGATYDEQDHSYTIGLMLLSVTAVATLAYTMFGIKKKTA